MFVIGVGIRVLTGVDWKQRVGSVMLLVERGVWLLKGRV